MLLNIDENPDIKVLKCHHIEADTILSSICSQIIQTDVLALAAHVPHKVNVILGLKRMQKSYGKNGNFISLKIVSTYSCKYH